MTKPLSILIIDDTISLMTLLSAKLTEKGHSVHCRSTIPEALEYLSQHEAPTFILADRMLDGPIEVQALGTLCEAAPASWVLVYTQVEELTREKENEILHRGAYRVLDKSRVDEMVANIAVLTQELDEVLQLAEELKSAPAERSRIMAALVGNDVAVSVVDRRFRRLFSNSIQGELAIGVCRNQCWTASYVNSSTPPECWGCTVADVFHKHRTVDELLLNAFADGSVKWVAVRSTPISSRNGDSVIAVREAVTQVNETALVALPLYQRLHHIAKSLVRAGFGRARIFKASSENEIKLLAAAARSDFPPSPISQYFAEVGDLAVDLNKCPYAQIAKKERVGSLISAWDERIGVSPLTGVLGFVPPYFDVPIWRDDGQLDGWIAVDFVSMDATLRGKAVSRLARKETLSWLQEEYGREIKRALKTTEDEPGHRDKFEIAQRARFGIAAARSVAEATREIREAFGKLLPQCRVSVRRLTAESLREFESLCWGDCAAGDPPDIRLDNQRSLAVSVVKGHPAFWICNYEEYSQTAAQQRVPVGFPPLGTRSTAQIPLRFENTIFGTLSIDSPAPIQWDDDGYREPLLDLAKHTALVLRDLALHEDLDKAMADRAAIIAYSVSASADALWRHWAQQRLAEASAVAARTRRLLVNPSGPKLEEARNLLLELSDVITRVDTARPKKDAAQACELAKVFLRLQGLYAHRQPSPSFGSVPNDIAPLKMPEFILVNIVMVLLDNALEAIEDSGKGSSITVEAHSENGFVGIEVSDDGPGVPDQERERILREPLPSKKGLGLGLLYARGAALQYSGDLSFTTSADLTRFTLKLPLVKS